MVYDRSDYRAKYIRKNFAEILILKRDKSEFVTGFGEFLPSSVLPSLNICNIKKIHNSLKNAPNGLKLHRNVKNNSIHKKINFFLLNFIYLALTKYGVQSLGYLWIK